MKNGVRGPQECGIKVSEGGVESVVCITNYKINVLIQMPSTLTQRGSRLAVRTDLGSKRIFSGVFDVFTSLYFLSIVTVPTLASYRANRMPMQLRGPWPNPRKVYLKWYKNWIIQLMGSVAL